MLLWDYSQQNQGNIYITIKLVKNIHLIQFFICQ